MEFCSIDVYFPLSKIVIILYSLCCLAWCFTGQLRLPRSVEVLLLEVLSLPFSVYSYCYFDLSLHIIFGIFVLNSSLPFYELSKVLRQLLH